MDQLHYFTFTISSLMRRGLPDLQGVMRIYYAASGAVRDREYRVDPISVLRLAQSSGCSAYDCEFIHLAEHLGTDLITLDKKLLSAFPEGTKKLTEVI